jgi:hypothetical protein
MSLVLMKNGTSVAILVTDLLTAEGPYRRVADDFIDAACSGCGSTDLTDLRFRGGGFFCDGCATSVATPW